MIVKPPQALSLSKAAILLGMAVLLGLRLEETSRAVSPFRCRIIPFALPDRNRVNSEAHHIPDSWDVEKGTNIRWSVQVGSPSYGGSVVVAAGRVFVGTSNENPRDPAIKGDKGVLLCLDEKTGDFLWQLVHDKLPAGRVADWPESGIRSSPVVRGDRLYYVSNRCEVVCADVFGDPHKPGKGKILWKVDMIGQLGVYPHNYSASSPLIIGDNVFVVTGNGVHNDHISIPAPEAPSFLALDRLTGAFRWQSNLPTQTLVEARKKGEKVDNRRLVNQGKLLMHGQWSSPVYAEPHGWPMVIFPGGDGWLYAFRPSDGELLWKFDCNPKHGEYVLGPRATRSDFLATPVVWENKLYIGVGQDPEHREGVGHLWCIDITRKPITLDKDLSPRDERFDPQDPRNKDSALVWHFGGFSPRPAENPETALRPYRFGRTLSTCAIHDGLCYAADLDGRLFCLDARTGKKYWDHDTKGSIWSSPYYADGKVFLGNDEDGMFVFQHGKVKTDPVELEMGGRVRAMPTAHDQTLFVITTSRGRLLAIGKR